MNSTSNKNMSSKTVKALARSKICNFTEAKFEWMIENYSLRPQKTSECITSPWFSDKNSNPKEWQMKIYPMGISEDSKKYISLMVHLNGKKSCFNLQNKIQLKLKLLNSKNMVLATFGPLSRKVIKGDDSLSEIGVPKMLKIKDLYKGKNKFMPEDELHIECEIAYYETQETTVSGPSTPLMPLIPNHSNRSFISHFQQLFCNKSLADVTIDVKGKKFDAHKLILSARSPVFFTLFQNDEKKTIYTLEVQDIEPDVFHEVLRFIYTDKVEKLDAMAPQLLAAADRYMLDLLKTECEVSLARNVTLANCGELLILAHLHSANNLKKILLDFVRCHSSEVAVTSNWQKLLTFAHPQLLRDISMAMMTTSQVPTAPPLSLIKKDV